MKTFPAALLAFLQSKPGKNCGRADLFAITLANGQVLRATSCQVDLAVANPDVAVSNALTTGGAIGQYVFWQNAVAPISFTIAVNGNAGGILDILIYVSAGASGPNGYIVRFDSRATYNSGQILKITNGTWMSIGRFYRPANQADVPGWHNLAFRSDANGQMSVAVDGLLQCVVTDATYPLVAQYGLFYGYEVKSGVQFADWAQHNAQGTYYASRYGAWQRGKITTEASFAPKANDMSLTALVSATVQFPGTTISLMRCVIVGLFDGAAVAVYTAYWPAGSAPSASLGVETKFVGQILDFQQTGRSSVEFTVADLLYLLNLKTPPKLIQASCRHTLYDANCTLVAANYGVSRSVAAGSTTQTINLNSAVAASVYAQGYLTFTSGQNSGLTLAIVSQPSTTQIVLAGVTPLPLGVGDTFMMYQGCNKTQARCNVLNNLINFGGVPYVPSPEVAI